MFKFRELYRVRILIALAILTVIAVVPVFFEAEAGKKTGEGFDVKTESHDPRFPYYDIRTDKAGYEKLAAIRQRAGRTAVESADARDAAVAAEDRLRAKLPSVKISFSAETGLPEVIAPEIKLDSKIPSLARGGSRLSMVRGFIAENQGLFGIDAGEAERLKVAADYTNPDGGMSFVTLRQDVDGIPVFAAEVRAGFAKDGSLIRVVNTLAANVDRAVSKDFGDPYDALRAAAGHIDHKLEVTEKPSPAGDNGELLRFGDRDDAPVAERTYFPLEPGVLVPAWRVLIWQPVNAFYVIVDAQTGEMLWRKNIVNDQTQAATYNVWTNPNSMVNTADSPFPRSPGPIGRDGTQAAAQPRSLVTLIGNETPYEFNNNGWITNGDTTTAGNAVIAGIDRDTTNGVDATNGVATSPTRNFDFPINPGIPDNPATNQGDSPTPAGEFVGTCAGIAQPRAAIDFQRAATVQLFYITNRYHDETYRLGFTEAAGNFQVNNFSRGGSGNDRVLAEAQDCNGVNNANFGTPSDGISGRMQMYLWTTPTPDLDGSLDADIVIHELTHGLTNRLHGNAAGLGSNMSGGMGEGWGDFFGHTLLSEPSDDPNGVYATGGYVLYRRRAFPNEFNNYYFGVRRFPKAIISSVGGPSNRPHNPLTFADIDSTQSNTNDGAFTPPSTGSTNDAVHAIGEVWSSMLWEVRHRYMQRLGREPGNRRILQHVTDGMKLSPNNPTFVDSRNAIIAAALANGTSGDVADIWAGFASRGLGASAVVLNPGSGGGTTRVTEAFDLPNLTQPGITMSDSSGDGDGVAEPGEPIRITVPLRNDTGSAATGVSATIVGGSTIAYGTIAHNAVASNEIGFTVPQATECGGVLDITINVTSSLGPVSFVRRIVIGNPVTTFTQNFDGVTAPAIPGDWTWGTEGGGIGWVTSTNSSDTAPNSAFALDPTTVGGATTLVSPSIPVQARGARLTFRNKYDTEAGWDGGVLELKIANGPWEDIIAAGGFFIEGGYNGVLGDGTNNPIDLRPAWTGNSGGYINTTVILPPAAAGNNVQLRWRFGADNNTAAVGWNVDTISFAGQYQCSFTPGPTERDVRGDFDGDGITDFSVYRPSDGNWYIYGSQAGFFAYNWGGGQDKPVPADYDRDGKTDPAIYRPNDALGGVFYLLKSNGFVFEARIWGGADDLPMVGDYDGDTIPDAALYRPSDGGWYILKTTGGTEIISFGQAGDVAVPGDFDGDGKFDQTVFRDGMWITRKSTGGVNYDWWGVSTDKLVPADYDGDNKDDLAIFRASDGVFWIKRSSDGGIEPRIWGSPGDIPVPGNYDSDNKADVGVYRNGEWYVLKTTGGTGAAYFGGVDDRAVPTFYIP